MIYDKLSNIQKYLGLNPNLDTAIKYLTATTLAKLPLGKTEIDGNAVYINVMETKTGSFEKRNYEIHRKYMDIQIDLLGAEVIWVGDNQEVFSTDFDVNSDFGTVRCKDLTLCKMGPGNFIMCLPMEPHMPGVKIIEEAYLKKAVVKVLW